MVKMFTKKRKAVLLIIVIFIMLFLSLIAMFISALESTYLESGTEYYRRAQNEFLSDAGLERAKEFIKDSNGDWRPWKLCPECDNVCNNCNCLDSPSCGGVSCNQASCDKCYLEEFITVPRGGKIGSYKVYVESESPLTIRTDTGSFIISP